MEHDEFHIGLEFWCGGRRWRCTDIGSRVIVAIRVDETEIATSEAGVVTHKVLTGDEAEREGWYRGPPYAVAETVFDEYDLGGCTLTAEEMEPRPSRFDRLRGHAERGASTDAIMDLTRGETPLETAARLRGELGIELRENVSKPLPQSAYDKIWGEK